MKEQIISTENGLLVRAPAKLNLCLLVSGKRPDGYHELETIMAKVNLCDELLLELTVGSDIQLICGGRYWAPQGSNNLVYKACKLVQDYTGQTRGIRITLTKNIPAGGGMGGASSDAAAVIIGLNQLLKLGLSRAKMNEIAAVLGSDVAFFLDGPVCLCTGRGEKVRQIADFPSFSALVILPDVNVSTKRVYENYSHDPILYRDLKPKIEGLIAQNYVDLTTDICANMLESSCFMLYKELADLKSRIESLNIGKFCLSGSGSAMYSLFWHSRTDKLVENQQVLTKNIGCESVIVNNNCW